MNIEKIEKTLESIGLREKEAKVYLALLSSGEVTATKLAERANLDRTLIYQLTNRLIDRGIVSYIIRNNVRYFSAAEPETLLKNLQEKEEELKKILPGLKARQSSVKEDTKVELYRGRRGVVTILRMILRDAEPYCLMGGAEMAVSVFELENKMFVKQAERQNLKGRILGRKNDRFFVGKNEEYRLLPEKMISLTTMMMWGTKTAIFVWSEPYHVILVNDKEITRSNLVTFDYLWEIAEKPEKQDMKKRLLK